MRHALYNGVDRSTLSSAPKAAAASLVSVRTVSATVHPATGTLEGKAGWVALAPDDAGARFIKVFPDADEDDLKDAPRGAMAFSITYGAVKKRWSCARHKLKRCTVDGFGL